MFCAEAIWPSRSVVLDSTGHRHLEPLNPLKYNFFTYKVTTKIEWPLRIVVRIILWVFSHILAI